jgi:NAD(P)-dependent dehydrogenase (short-subunit alcohol dehydrogenase family)
VYNASKFAVEGLSETLAEEVKGFGINITLVEPNGYATDWSGASAIQTKPMPEYQPVRDAFAATAAGDIWGVPEATANAILQLVDNPNPPLRLFLGKMGLPWAKQVYAGKLATWEAYEGLSAAAHGK